MKQPMTHVEVYTDLLRPGRLRALPSRELLLHASRFARVEDAVRPDFEAQGARQLRVSLLATLSTQHLVAVLKLFLYAEGFAPQFVASEFDGVVSEGLSPDSRIWQSNPEILVILPALEDIRSWPSNFAGADEIDQWVEVTAEIYLRLWNFAADNYPNLRIYQAGFVAPIERSLGNLEHASPFSRTRCLQRLNDFLMQRRPSNVTLVDLEGLSAQIGKLQWFDETAYFVSKQPMSLRAMPTMAAYLARLIAAGHGYVRKCLVLDLDNTLWGGVIGDDGLAGIRLDPADPAGEAFRAFQRYVLLLKQRGVLLAVCSKNNHATAVSAFEHEGMLLKPDDFSAFVANWDDKVANLKEIASTLNIGMDALVFFDDNPAERALVEQFARNVLVVDVPEDPAMYVRALDLSFAFEWPQLTVEDLGRTDSYLQNRQREALQEQFTDYGAYLRSLDMKAWVELATAASLDRVCQLINKTNQFNLRTQRYSEEALLQMLESPDHAVIQVRFEDRFSRYGVMACVVLRFVGEIAFIENWVMSCRVFKRGLEDATMNAIVKFVRDRGYEFLMGEYIPTAKNGHVADIFERFGFENYSTEAVFTKIAEQFGVHDGTKYWKDLRQMDARPHEIEIMTPDQV